MTHASPARTEIREFFATYASSADDPDGAAAHFCDPFLTLDPSSTAVVTRDRLAASLPSRAGMFAAIGASGVDLATLEEVPLDAHHTLAETTWHVRFTDPGAAPMTLASAFLLRREEGGWRVAVYLNHADLASAIRDRLGGGAAGPTSPGGAPPAPLDPR